MKPKILIVSLVAALLLAGTWLLRPDAVEPVEVGPTEVTLADEVPDEKIKLQLDQTEVFQRAFWRRPSEADRILNAERRHWVSVDDENVSRWQWFIEVEPGPDFTQWLVGENPFGLVQVQVPEALPEFDAAPEWMPVESELARLAAWRKPGSDFFVFIDSRNQRLFATDHGGGFNLAQN
jgi:hypothetical protein